MPRLPVPGADDGTWGTVLNEFLSVAHAADGSINEASLPLPLEQSQTHASPDTDTSTSALHHTIGTSANQAAAGNHGHTLASLTDYDNSPTATTGQVITFNGSQFTPADAEELAGYGVYPLAAYGFVAIAAPPESFSANGGDGGGGWFRVIRIWVPAGKAIQGVSAYVHVQGTYGGSGWNGFALYDDDGNQIGVTADTPTLWSVQGWREADLTSPIVAQAAGRFVRVGLLSDGYSGLEFKFADTTTPSLLNGGHGVTNRRNVFQSGVAIPPASFDPATYGTAGGYLPAVALY